MLQRQVEVGTVAEAYFQMLLRLCDNQVDVLYLSSVLGLFCYCTLCSLLLRKLISRQQSGVLVLPAIHYCSDLYVLYGAELRYTM